MKYFENIQKAIGEVLLLISSFTGAAVIGEDQISELIKHTELLLEKAKAEQGTEHVLFSDGLSGTHLASWLSDQARIKRYLSSPDILAKCTPTQAAKVRELANEVGSLPPTPTANQ